MAAQEYGLVAFQSGLCKNVRYERYRVARLKAVNGKGEGSFMPREKNMQNVAEQQTDAVYQQLMSPDSDTREKFTEVSGLFENMAEAMADDDPQNEKEIKKLAEGFQSLENAQSKEDVRRSLQQISGLKEFLHGKDTDGQSGYDKVKELYGDDNTDLYRSLSFLENTLQVDLEVSGKLDEDYQPTWQVTDTDAKSPWEAYARKQLAKKPETEKEQIDCMAKAMVGKFMHALPVLKAEPGTAPGPEESFSTSKAETYAKQLKNNPSFKRYFKDPENFQKHMKDPSHLVSTCVNITHPFKNVDPKKQKEILGKLSVLLSNAENRYGLTGGKEWKEYKKSLASIDVNDPDSYDKQLQNVFDKASAYMKGRKSLRGNNWAQEKFDIALASIAELSEAGEFAHNAAQALMDRTNEVRIGHDRNYQPKTLDEYRINPFSYNDPSKKIGTYSNQEINIYQDMNAEALKAITETTKEEDYENTFI